MKKFFLLVSVLVLAACATGNQPRYYYNEVLIINNSKGLVQDVTISAVDASRNFSCGNIAPFGICSNRFARQSYLGKPLRIGWIIAGGARQSVEFVLEVPVTLSTAFPLRGVVEVGSRGAISAYFEQDGPNR